jgi:acetoin utilization deacetylase AcuC-like enzyme
MQASNKNSVQIIKDERFLDHLENVPHPESPKRLKVVYEYLSELDHLIPIIYIKPRYASENELALIHDPAYIREIKNIRHFPTYLDPDTPVTEHSFQAAILAAGGLLEAVDTVIKGKAAPVFALVRPPGHHAERDFARGFCLFNNVAVGARYAQKKHGIKRVLICDWDVHHGNGTQHSFYDDPSVLYFSIHQYPHYPGTGHIKEIGVGPGEGFTINCPLPPGQGDREYRAIFQKILMPIALEYQPELILISAGFDSYINDPLAGMDVTEEGFAFMTSALMDLASSCCPGRIILSLEGGYHLHGIAKCISRVIQTLSDEMDKVNAKEKHPETIKEGASIVIKYARSLFSAYWKCLEAP